jgi:hypothetical protein
LGDTERARLMAASVAAAARTAGLPDEAIDLVGRAHALAMAPRLHALDDDHHPAYLHPGRSVLVLLRDVGPLPAETLAAAAVHETVDDELRVGHSAVRRELGDAVADLVGSLPRPGDERLAERLVTLEEGPRLAALAERLDQLRHAHLRPDRDWRAAHEEAGTTWLPVAERTHARLADRYRNWHRAFARRLEKRGGG